MTDIVFHEDGSFGAIYDDGIAPLLREIAEPGTLTTTRASHVEPDPFGEGLWIPDMTPSGGPAVLGRYLTRAEALAAEKAWLEEHR